MPRFSLHAVGTNRPGIVSGVTEAIAEAGWDISGSAMTLLEGQFAVFIVLDAGSISDGRLVEQVLGNVAEELDLFIAVRPVNETPEPFSSGASITLSMSGANQPGIVAAITRVLAEIGADIRHLDSRMVEDSLRPGYVMEVEAALPSGSDRSALEATILRVARELGVTCTIVPEDVAHH
jgi:glycine cleavage system transcriptional repressor